MVDKFWYVLSAGIHRDKIFTSHPKESKIVGISNLYNKYFNNLKMEFESRKVER